MGGAGALKRGVGEVARLTIEDKWWSDPRRGRLVKYFGGESQLADGLATQAWRMAQEFWKVGRGLVPKSHFERLENSQNLIEVGLAEVRGESVYIRGSSAYLEWIAEQREIASEAGKKSAKMRRDKYGSAQPSPRTSPERPSNASRTESNALEPSVSVFVFEEKERGEAIASQSSAHADPLPPLARIWNQFAGNLPKVKECSSKRRKAVSARMREHPELDYWTLVISKLNDSPFCRGDNNRQWRATFDFLIQPGTAEKALEGAYDNRSAALDYRPTSVEEIFGASG